MKIAIFNKNKIEALAHKGFAPHTALISITDAEWEYASLENKPEFLFQVAFDDIDNDVFVDELGRAPTDEERTRIEAKYRMLTDAQAGEIADFILSIKGKADLLICQCEHRQSRSAAVAAAVLEYLNKSGIKTFAVDHYYPNKMVFKKVLAQLQKKTAL